MNLLQHNALDSRTNTTSTRSLHDAQQVLLQRARFLSQEDRTLLELALAHSVSRRRISQILNLHSSVVTRRLQRIVRRLSSPLIVALLDPRCTLPDELRQIGIEHFLQKSSMSHLSQLHRIPRHVVRRMLQNVLAWFRWTHQSR